MQGEDPLWATEEELEDRRNEEWGKPVTPTPQPEYGQSRLDWLLEEHG